MRVFVETFRQHLSASGAPSDDETVWQIPRRLQILVFDFSAPANSKVTKVCFSDTVPL
jgi:hypothetical protein